ncbi:MAG: tRNA threonylcarbamoyladenosine dehydratase, partial [Draconibacterium sp.]|nr:tRNA threonylcarbamoyladenosine dehydratase [Draconibacterium sp.]
ERTELLLGEEKLGKLKKSNVLVVGLGGVGAYTAEQLCRAGVGKMTIVDGDVVEHSNINRQLPALLSNINKPKADVLAKRFLDINPELEITVFKDYVHDEKILELLKNQTYDYVVDAIDTLTPKIFLIYHALQLNLKVVSSMGAGGKIDPSCIKVADISKSYSCKLARLLRKRLSKFGIKKGVQVVFSSEKADEKAMRLEEGQNKKSTVGTISYMPATFGCFLSSVVIRSLMS